MCKECNGKNYVGLHNHTDFSILDGYAKVDEYISAAKEMGMIGLGIADHGTASGLFQLITKAKKAGLIPVPGVEFYVAPENPEGAKVRKPIYYGYNGERAPKYDVSGNGKYLHLTVFAYNNKGLENLFKLSALSYQQEHFYGKPRIDTNMLAEHSEGLIVTTGCPSSEVNRRFLLGQDNKAYEYASRLQSIFGENMYVEIMNHNMADELERILTPKLIKLAKDLNIPIIATNDCHYARKEDAIPHERQLAMQMNDKMSTLPSHEGGTRFAFSGPEYHLKSYDEMYSVLPEDIAEEALHNTIELTKKCQGISLRYDPHLRPTIDVPEGYDHVSYFKKLISDGFKKKRKNATQEVKEESNRRVKEEFKVIHSNDFIPYFLVVHDYIDFAHKNGISLGKGRGSIGGSEIAYLLDISDTDPIRFDLLFERFLSPGRGAIYHIDYMTGESEDIPVSEIKLTLDADGNKKKCYIHELNPGDVVSFNNKKAIIKDVFVKIPGAAPDVDTDFHTERRQEVIDYCINKYGKENVANIITFGTFKAKSSFKAICTIYEKPFNVANAISKLIPPPLDNIDPSIDDLFNPTSIRYAEGADFRSAVEGDEWAEVIEMARPFDGRIKETGVHPCGLIVANRPLAGIIPTQVRQDDGVMLTQWTYPECESLGLIKMDFLGLDTVDIIDLTVENIKNSGKVPPNMQEITDGPMDDKKTYEMLQRGETIGVFQLAGTGVRELLKKSQPTQFADIYAITALYRPGPMSTNAHNEWADRKNGAKDIVYLDESLKGTEIENILKDTEGILVFQEQTMQIAQRYAGLTSHEADVLRKAMGKKKMDVMMSLHDKFIEGAVKNGADEQVAQKVWDTMEGFAQYAFNKCLAARTLISTPEGKVSIQDLHEKYVNGEEIWVHSMFENGEIKLHKVKEVVQSGKKPLYQVVTKSGKKIRITKEHRLLTTEGYRTIEDGGIAVGKELIVDEKWGNHTNEIKLTEKSTQKSTSNDPMEYLIEQYLIERGVDLEVRNEINTPMTPLNYKDVIDEAIMNHHIENGDKIVAIIEPKLNKAGKQYTEMTYDIEMEDFGPSNFIADGIVSHNSHSVSYAINAYQTAYLKANYPAEFMAARIRRKTEPKQIAESLQEVNRLGLRLGAVDINKSLVHISIPHISETDAKYDIVYGFAGVKQINESISEDIVNERNANGPFTSVANFINRMNKQGKISPSVVSNLALTGAFDELGVSRKLVQEKANMLISSSKKKASKGRNLFDIANVSTGDVTESIDLQGEDFSYVDKIKNEANLIGLFVSGHPAGNLGPIANSYNATTIKKLRSSRAFDSNERCILGTITEIKAKTRRNGSRSIAITIDDKTDTYDVYLPKQLVASITKWEEMEKTAKRPDRKILPSMQALIDDDSVIPMPALEKYEVYAFYVKTRGFDNTFRMVVTNVDKLQTAPNGTLTYDLIVNSAKQIEQVTEVAKKYKSKAKNAVYIRYFLNEDSDVINIPIKLTRNVIMELESIVSPENILTRGI